MTVRLWRLFTRLGVLVGASTVLAVLVAGAISLARFGDLDRRVVEALAVAALAGILAAFVLGVIAARGFSALKLSARRIAADDLTTPVSAGGITETRRLAEAMEEMRLAVSEAREHLVQVNRGLTQRAETSSASLTAATRELSVLNRIASLVVGGQSRGFSAVADEIVRLDWVDGTFIALASEEQRLTPGARSNLGPDAVRLAVQMVQDVFPPEALQRGIFIEDTSSSTPTRPLVAQGVRSLSLVPLDTPDGVAGVIGCVGHVPVELSPERQLLLRSIADQVAVTLQRSELADEAEESRRLADSVLREMSDGVIVIDAEERCRVCNPAAARMLHLDRAGILGQRTTAWFPLPPSILQTLQARIDNPGESAMPLLAELDGRQLALSAGPFADPDAAQRGVILLIRDLSDEAEAERIKRDFVSMVGHELRTPLTTIRTSIDLLLEAEAGPLNATQQRIVDVLQTNSDRLLQLISDLLDMSALDSGRIEVRQETTDLTDIVREAVESQRPEAAAKSIVIETPAQPDGGAPVWADRARVRQVLVNLIGNAVKYTAEGGYVGVHIVLMGPFARVDVQDNGIGIPLAEQEHLFEKFFRARAAQRQSGGTGLGLAIARSIVELHGGEIWCESDGQSGSTFSFTLPRGRPGEVAG